MSDAMPETRRSLKLLAFIEAATVTGPGKNLIDFCRSARLADRMPPPTPLILSTLGTFHRTADTRITEENAPSTPFLTAVRKADIPITVLPERYRFDLRVIDAIKELVARDQPDILQTHSIKSHFLMRLSGLPKSRPWVAFHHGYTNTDAKDRAYNLLNRWSLRAADRVITMSDVFAAQLQREGVRKDRILVLHNTVRPERFADISAEAVQAARAALGIAAGEKIVLAVGRLSFEKGHIDLVHAFAELLKQELPFKTRLVLVGEGPERPRIEQAAAECGIGDALVFAGQVTDVLPYYAMADIMALPSHSEGSPNALLEAMAAKKATVATRVGGVPEIVTDGCEALVVNAKDPHAMATALERLLSDPVLAARLGGNAYGAVLERHSPDRRNRILADVYAALIR